MRGSLDLGRTDLFLGAHPVNRKQPFQFRVCTGVFFAWGLLFVTCVDLFFLVLLACLR
jgi:hypothetical protein